MDDHVMEVGELQPLWPDAPRFDPRLELPPYRFLPGYNDRPDDNHCNARGFWAAVDLYHAGYLWEAHEVWEDAVEGNRRRSRARVFTRP